MVEGPVAKAASTRARLVSDFEPGTCTVARTGSLAIGAGQRPEVAAARCSTRAGVYGSSRGRVRAECV